MKTKAATSRQACSSKLAQGKITKPLVNAKTVAQRGRELALIAGRGTRSAVRSDRQNAKRELTGAIHPTVPRPRPDLDTAQWDPAPVSIGRRAKQKLPGDDQITKELVEEGVDEAEHDEMLTARKRRSVLDE